MKIAVAGYGVEGRASYAYFSAQGHDVTIVDERAQLADVPAGAKTLLGPDVFGQLQDFEVVIRTPSLDPARIVTNGTIWSATNEFFAKCPARINGETGSKGKGTTCSFLASILRAAGRTVHLVGNIGVPALDVLPRIMPNDIVVYELSSFQLWDAVKSPQIAIITHMEAEHLDVHHDVDDYIEAKARIRRFQTMTDICFYAPRDELAQRIIDMPAAYEQDAYQARDWRFRAFHYGLPNERDASIPAAYVDKGVFHIQRPGQDRLSVFRTSIVKLPGDHNLENACAAICAALLFDVSDQALEQGISSFMGLPHRLRFVATKADVTYYDDSIATTPGASSAAMKSFDTPKVMIFGGSSKGAEYNDLAAEAAGSQVRVALVIGDEAAAIEQAMQAHNVIVFNLGSSVTMHDVVAMAATQAEPGDTVILSPACASFGMFANYSDRGDQFIAAVNGLDV